MNEAVMKNRHAQLVIILKEQMRGVNFAQRRNISFFYNDKVHQSCSKDFQEHFSIVTMLFFRQN